jgi:RHS repeat-associated protein
MKRTTLCLLFLLGSLSLHAQTGKPNFGSFSESGFDVVNNQYLNILFSIPIVSSSGRGVPLSLSLVNNSLIWQNTGSAWTPIVDNNGNPTWGWTKDFPAGGVLHFTPNVFSVPCPVNKLTVTHYSGFYYVDAFGTNHRFSAIDYYATACPAWQGGTQTAYADDHTGYYADGGNLSFSVTAPNGKNVVNGNGTVVDINGNYVTKTVVSATESDWTDSTGNTALKIIYSPTVTAPTSVQYQFQDGNGVYQTITAKLQAYNLKTNFACANVSEYSGTAYLPYELDIPSPVSGTIKYTFTYEGTPGHSGYYTGRVQQVTLPTGGYYKYAYAATNDGINCSDGSTLNMTRTVNDGTNSAIWNYVRNTTNLTTTVTTPQLADTPNANDTVFTFANGTEVSRKIYGNSPGTALLRTVNTTWASNGTPATSITILEDGTTQSEVATTFDSNGLLDSLTEYDWGSGSPGSPLRTTNYSYQTSSNYTAQNLINLVTSKVIKDGSGTVQYRQDTTYDGTALSCPPGVPQHDDTGHPCTSNYRGNPTTVTTYTSPAVPSGGIAKSFTYDWFGNLLTAQLNCCTQKTWSYSSTTKYSQPDSVTSGTSPNQLTTSYNYNPYQVLVTKATDPNGLATSYSYDFLQRPLVVSQANGSVSGQSVTYNYNDTSFVTTVKTTIDTSKSVQQISSADGLGRVVLSTTEDGSNNIIAKLATKYDLVGTAYQSSNPYITASPSYWTTTAFDVLGRPTSVTLPDGSATNYTYTIQTVGTYKTEATKIVDPAGKARLYQSDPAGRLATATEPDSGNNLVNTTYYTYSVLDSLTKVADTQTSPTQTRTYVYDSLGRLFTETTPEGGTTCFGTVSAGSCTANTGYDNFDNLLHRTDARGVVTSYSYDGLNRVTGSSYNVTGATGVPATSTVSLTYGASGCSSAHGAGCIGQLITMTDGVGSENYTYNSLEQTTQLQKIISGTTYTTNYAYNIAGELTQITYPSGRVIQQSVDAIGRLCEIAPSTTGCGTAASPYATGFIYSAASQLEQLKYGNNLYGTFGYSPDRLQLNCLDHSNQNRSGTCAHDANTRFGLDYIYGTSTTNDGQITKISDYINSGRTVAYTYDNLARLSAAHTSGSTTYPAWSLSWNYDRYGNRWSQNLISGPGYGGSVTIDPPTNHILATTSPLTTFAYDANGNMTNDNSNTLVYDAENRAVSATNSSASGTYTYDGNSLRVKRVSGSTTTVYIFSGSKVIAEYDNGAAPTAPSREYIYAGSAMLAKIDSTGTNYYFRDHLSARYVANASGTLVEQLGQYPFGDPWYNANNDKLFFTSYERDSESSNDYAQARFYRWLLGRFLTPDPAGAAAVDITNPQSWNSYAYVLNHPISLLDPSGLVCTWDDGTSDDSPENGGAGEADCASQMGTWTSDTVQVVIDSDGFAIRITVSEPGNLISPPLTDPGYSSPSQGGGDLTGSGGNTSGGFFSHTKTGCFIKGAAVGAATAVGVGLVTAAVVSAGVVSAPVASGALLVVGAVGGAVALYNGYTQASNGNWAGAAYSAGTIAGGAAGGSVVGTTVGDAINPAATRGWSLSRDWGNRFRLNFPGGSIGKWLGSGPDAAAGAGATGAAGAGAATAAKGGC